jgi:hypothetical protein
MATSMGSATSSALSTSLVSASPTSVPDSTSTLASPSKKKKKGISGGAIAGIVVGVLLALAVIAAIIFVIKRRSKIRRVPELAATSPPQYHAAPYAVEKDANGVAELATPVNELHANGVKGSAWPHGKSAELDSTPLNRT